MQVQVFSSQKQAIAVTAGYLLLVYATLPLTPILIGWVRAYGFLKIFIAVLLFLVMLFLAWGGAKASRLKTVSFWLAVMSIIYVYYYATGHTVALSERLHLWLYAVLGFFLFSTLRYRLTGASLFAATSVIVTSLGMLDEFIQYLLPNRHFDWNDILLNGLGGIMSLIAIRYVFGDKGKECAP